MTPNAEYVKRMKQAEDLVNQYHAGQFRSNSVLPYKYHLYDVMKRVAGYGVEDIDVLVAALCHDLVEDTEATPHIIEVNFGSRVRDIVMECTLLDEDDKPFMQKLTWLESFAEKSIEALLIKLADRVCNVLDYYTAMNVPYAAVYAAQAYPVFNRVRKIRADSPPVDIKLFRSARKSVYAISKDVALMDKIVQDELGVALWSVNAGDVVELRKRRR